MTRPVFCHGGSAGDVIDPLAPAVRWFGHSGDLGDII